MCCELRSYHLLSTGSWPIPGLCSFRARSTLGSMADDFLKLILSKETAVRQPGALVTWGGENLRMRFKKAGVKELIIPQAIPHTRLG